MNQLEGDEEDKDAYWDRFETEAQIIFETWFWMSRYHARDIEGSEGVALFDNQYFILLPEGEGLQGPYATLEGAILAGELNHVYEFTFKIDAPTLSDESLKELLYYDGTFKHTLIVNGKKWRTRPGSKLEPVPDGDSR